MLHFSVAKYGVWGLVLFNLLLAAWWLLGGNVLFHSDIARDFYLMKDIWDYKHLTLIGARAGGLSGWFHGPLWLYLNLPAYILGRGNPVVVGWGWFGLHLMTCGLVFFVAKKIFDSKMALLSLLIYSTVTILEGHGYTNPQGATLIFPLFFYFYWRYKNSQSALDLTISLFLVGLLIQFQIAFGAPIFILTIIDTFVKVAKGKNPRIFLSYLVLLLPLLTYILFDLRHNFLQFKSLLSFSGEGQGVQVWKNLKAMPVWVYLSLIWLLGRPKSKSISLFFFFYIGFWIMALFYPGQIMGYYYAPFLPVLVIVFASLVEKLPIYLYGVVLAFILVSNWMGAIKDTVNYTNTTQDWSTWKSLSRAAQEVITRCGKGSGYYVYTADLYGYNLRYAIEYEDKLKDLALNQKKPITCLVMGPNVVENKYGSDNWKSGDVKISGKMVEAISYKNGIKIEKYQLDPQDMAIKSNPNLIKDTILR